MNILPIKKRYWMVKKHLSGASVVYLCGRLDISRTTFYYHWNNFQKFDWDGLKVKPRVPHTIHRTSQNVINQVISIRKERGWGPDKIEQYLKSEGIKIGHTTIRNLLIDAGLNNFIDEPRKTWGNKRFERSHSNSLWQADFKLTKDDLWMITYLDDHSRFIRQLCCRSYEIPRNFILFPVARFSKMLHQIMLSVYLRDVSPRSKFQNRFSQTKEFSFTQLGKMGLQSLTGFADDMG